MIEANLFEVKSRSVKRSGKTLKKASAPMDYKNDPIHSVQLL
jgi:hypothetical protein